MDISKFAQWIRENITMSDNEQCQDGLGLGTSPNGTVPNPEDPEDPEEDVSDHDVIWVPNDLELRKGLVRNGTIPEEPNLEGNSNGYNGLGLAFPPIRLSNDIEIVFETPRPKCVFLRCVDEVSPFDQEKGNAVAAMCSDQVHAMAKDIVGQILDGMGVDQNGNMPLVESNDVEIVYEAAASDEVEIGEEYVVEEDDSEVEEVEEGEVLCLENDSDCLENDSDDTSFEAVNPVGPRPERQFKEFEGDDAEEKADLVDEGWEVQKNLRTDLQRLRHAQRAFGNCIPTDPTRCLTFHGYAKLSEEQKDADHRTEQVLVKKWMDTKIEDGIIYNENIAGSSSSVFASPEVGSRKRRANDGHEIGPERKRLRIKFDIIERKMWRMLNQVKRPLFSGGYGDNRRNFERYVGHYKSGLKETREFLNFYDDVNNNTLVDSEFGHMETYELLYKQFVTVYGPNTSELCKDCTYHEQMDVCHPY